MMRAMVGYAWIDCSAPSQVRGHANPPYSCDASLRIEITQVRRRLALAARHQEAVGAQVVDFAADPDQRGSLDAIGLDPVEMRLRLAQVSLVDGPRPRQRIVDHRDLVMQDIRIGLVEIDALLED